MKKALLAVLLVLCCMLFTACYTDSDPWPAADALPSAPPTATVVPATQVPPTQPPATAEPLPEDAVDTSPNFNG